VSDCFSGGTCSGGYSLSAIQYIRDSGIPDEACYPYTATNSSCSSRCSDYASRLVHIPNTYYDFSYTSSDIKNLLSSNGPVAISFFIGSAHGGYFDGSGVYRCTDDAGSGGAYGTNHAVLAVGYDDSGGYYLVKNSWGTWWNGDGYFKLGYDECNVEDSQIVWIQSSLPVIKDHFLYMPGMVVSPTHTPGSFSKSSPSNGATIVPTTPTLDWANTSNAISYEYCYDLTINGDCTGGWNSTGSASQVTLPTLPKNYTYEWQARAVNAFGYTYANNGTEWSFTTNSSGVASTSFTGGRLESPFSPGKWVTGLLFPGLQYHTN
jgi:hypothetical protein